MHELPPGQSWTAKFPVVGETSPLADWNRDTAFVDVAGLVAHPRRWTMADLLALPQHTRTHAIHCVTGWSRRSSTSVGVPLADVLAAAGVRPEARFVRFVAHTARAHDTSLPLERALAHTWLVHTMDGAPLTHEHGGPLRTVTEGLYFYKSLKWLARIELLAIDRPGYWERESAYHNEADPLREQRFDASRTTPRAEVECFRDATDFAPWRGQVLLKARLGGWDPRSRDLSGLQLKLCSLRNASLAGASFKGANLSLSNLEGADLRGCDFTGADLEGASFAGADLREARLVDVACSATRFFRDFSNGRRLAARIDGLTVENARGLLEDQEAFLHGGSPHTHG
ncbi:MAG TPA: molybdopterin-dependent oxidoreductase [Nevskiaceae bacterium]|nr:molybdopterin-dependent oxidoreductase [Nevskiaceae bacterium]